MSAFAFPPALPEAWLEVLQNVEETLRRTEASIAQQEQAISAVPTPSAGEKIMQWEHGLQSLATQRAAWPALLQRAAAETTEADRALQEAEAALRRWLSQADELEQKLAKWGEPEVS